MKKRIKILGAVTLFCLLSASVALPVAGDQPGPLNSLQESTATQLPPVQLRAFSSGVAFVKKPFAAIRGGQLEQEFALPRGTILETLNVQGVEVSLIRKLQTDGTLVVEVCGIPETNTPSLSYLVRDAIRWDPLYVTELSTGGLRAYAATDNLCNFPKAQITFVMGSPHLVGEIRPSYRLEAMYRGKGRAVPSPPKVPVSLGELWEYRYEGLIELKKGESIRLPLFNASLKLEPVYYWDGEEVALKHKFVNSLNKPLAPGRVECYECGSWVGEDTLDWVAIDAEGEIISQYAPDIEVEEKTIVVFAKQTHFTVRSSESWRYREFCLLQCWPNRADVLVGFQRGSVTMKWDYGVDDTMFVCYICAILDDKPPSITIGYHLVLEVVVGVTRLSTRESVGTDWDGVD